MSEPRHPDPDAADVRRVIAGDQAAFAHIVERWQGRLVSLAWRFCRDEMAAEDMAQEAFVRAFRALHTFRGDSTFSTWLTAIAMNVYRSALRDRPPLAVSVEGAALRADDRDPLEHLTTRERLLAVRQMVMTLPPRYRDPIVLYYFQDMNVVETARILGIPEGTLKARLHRGKDFLRRRLKAAGVAGAATATDAPQAEPH